MLNPQVSNPNDFKVVTFKNPNDFTFTPEMGCMYDSRPIFGITGAPGINGGESMILPYHVAHQLAINLAKVSMTRQAPSLDPAGIPTGVPLWDTAKLENLKNSYLTDMYMEDKPVAQSETDILMAKVEELRKLVVANVAQPVEPVVIAPQVVASAPNSDTTVPPVAPVVAPTEAPKVYQDKAEVIAELEKRNIKFDARSKKENLEKLLA